MVHWESEAKRVLKAELARQGVNYAELAEKLAAIGVRDNRAAIANRISRGRFTFIFFLQCMRALGVEEVRLTRERSGR
jgi:hypothetical protein